MDSSCTCCFVSRSAHFLREHGLTRGAFVTACCESEAGARHWPNSNLIKLAQQIGVSTVVFTKKGNPPSLVLLEGNMYSRMFIGRTSPNRNYSFYFIRSRF
jgi:hypothetical protein